jgi:hypothetical protein
MRTLKVAVVFEIEDSWGGEWKEFGALVFGRAAAAVESESYEVRRTASGSFTEGAALQAIAKGLREAKEPT